MPNCPMHNWKPWRVAKAVALKPAAEMPAEPMAVALRLEEVPSAVERLAEPMPAVGQLAVEMPVVQQVE